MSIERQARDQNSSLHRFLDEWLPRRSAITDRWRGQLQETVLPAVDGGRAHLGRALEVRIGLDVGESRAYSDLLGFLDGARVERLYSACGFEAPVTDESEYHHTLEPMARAWERRHHPLQVSSEQVAALDAILDATGMDQISHKLPESLGIQQRRMVKGCLNNLPGAAQSVHAPLVAPLTDLVRRYFEDGRRNLLSLGERVLVAPVLIPGFAVADLVIGLTLVDVKLYAEPRPHFETWLDQLLGYLLLDRWDCLCLNRLAVYCGWQAQTLTVDVVDILGEAPARPTLHDLRREFWQSMRDDLDEADIWYQRNRFPAPSEAIRTM